MLNFTWKEAMAFLFTSPVSLGFGSFLIKKGLPKAVISWEFDPAGLVCTVKLPIANGVDQHTLSKSSFANIGDVDAMLLADMPSRPNFRRCFGGASVPTMPKREQKRSC